MKKIDLNLNDEISSLTTELALSTINLASYFKKESANSLENFNAEIGNHNKRLAVCYENLQQVFERLKAYPCEKIILNTLEAKYSLRNLYIVYEEEFQSLIHYVSTFTKEKRKYLLGKLSYINKVINLIEYTLDVCNKFPKGIKKLQVIEDDRKRPFPKIKLNGSVYKTSVGLQLGRLSDFFVDYNEFKSFDEVFSKAFSYTFELYDNGKLVSQKNLQQVLCHTLYPKNQKRTTKHQKDFFFEINRAIIRFDEILSSTVLEVELHHFSKSYVKNNSIDDLEK